jgi:hypothetical protein
VAGWLAPVLIAVSAALLGRAHYVIYALQRRTRSTVIVTWLVTVLVTGFWSWKAFGVICGENV